MGEEGADHQPCIDDASDLDKMVPNGKVRGKEKNMIAREGVKMDDRGRLKYNEEGKVVLSYLKDRGRGFSGWRHQRFIPNLDH